MSSKRDKNMLSAEKTSLRNPMLDTGSSLEPDEEPKRKLRPEEC